MKPVSLPSVLTLTSILSVASLACFGQVAPDSTNGTSTNPPAPSSVAPPTKPPGATSRPPDPAPIAATQGALVGGSFRVRRIDIGGGAPGTAPPNYEERVEGDLLKVCFGADQTLTACECDEPVFASVYDIGEGQHPVDRCAGALVCTTGAYHFDAEGRLRVTGPFDARRSLLWPVVESPSGDARNEAGKVTTRAEGTFVTDLCGLGHALLEPVAGCTP